MFSFIKKIFKGTLCEDCFDGNIEAVKKHLAAGEDVNAKEGKGAYPIFSAAHCGDIELIKLLINNGANVNTKGYHGATALHIVAKNGPNEIAELLIAEGADVDRWGDGATPLILAIIGGNIELVELLIAKGACVNAKGKKYYVRVEDYYPKDLGLWSQYVTPLDLATNEKLAYPFPFRGGKEIGDLLRKHGGKHGTIHSAVGSGDVEAVRELLAAGADVNAKNGDRSTPLHHGDGGMHRHKEVVELLIAKGLDMNDAKNVGGTILTIASAKGHKEVVELLINEGADVNAKNNEGRTPLDWATHPCNRNASAETAELLRKHGGKTGAELKAEGK